MIGSLLHIRTMLCQLNSTQSTILRISACTIEAGLPVRPVFALSACVGTCDALLRLISIHTPIRVWIDQWSALSHPYGTLAFDCTQQSVLKQRDCLRNAE